MTRSLLAALLLAAILTSFLDLWGANAKERYREQVAVLMYHHVHDTDQSSGTVSTVLFRDQLRYLQNKGYHFITLREFERFYEGGPVPDKAVLVTFDDGYRSFYDYAFPVLKELDVPAVNFAITKDLAAPDAPYIPALSPAQSRELLAYKPGMIDLQCHSDNLHFKEGTRAALDSPLTVNGTLETDEQYQARLTADSKACAQALSGLYGTPDAVTAYAYPFGIFNPVAQQRIHAAGFKYAFTIIGEMATRASLPLEIPRINAGSPDITPDDLDRRIQMRVELPKR